MPKIIDLFCGRWGWSRAFAAKGWHCVGIDMVTPPEIPDNCTFLQCDVMTLTPDDIREYAFGCASSPCQEFSVYGMKHFHPNPKYPEMGIKLFNHTRDLFEESGIPYVMENVRAAQQFVGNAISHCGPFYLWGSAVPPLMPQGIKKGIDIGKSYEMVGMTREEKRNYRKKHYYVQTWSKSKERAEDTSQAATIPYELSVCVADYATQVIKPQIVC